MAGRWSVYLPLLLVYGVLGLRLLVAARGAALLVRDPRVGLGKALSSGRVWKLMRLLTPA